MTDKETRREELGEILGWEYITGFLPRMDSAQKLEDRRKQVPEDSRSSQYLDEKDRQDYPIET